MLLVQASISFVILLVIKNWKFETGIFTKITAVEPAHDTTSQLEWEMIDAKL